MPLLEPAAVDRARSFWSKRALSRSDDPRQTSYVSSLLRSAILPTDFYESALDIGCGRGRFVPLLSSFCSHVWAVDVVPELLCDIEYRSPSATAFCVARDYKLPDGPHDFLWSSFFLQHLVPQKDLQAVCAEIRRVMAPGARVLLLENAKDRASHVRPWTPRDYALELGLAEHRFKMVSVNDRPADHWWIEGRMK